MGKLVGLLDALLCGLDGDKLIENCSTERVVKRCLTRHIPYQPHVIVFPRLAIAIKLSLVREHYIKLGFSAFCKDINHFLEWNDPTCGSVCVGAFKREFSQAFIVYQKLDAFSCVKHVCCGYGLETILMFGWGFGKFSACGAGCACGYAVRGRLIASFWQRRMDDLDEQKRAGFSWQKSSTASIDRPHAAPLLQDAAVASLLDLRNIGCALAFLQPDGSGSAEAAVYSTSTMSSSTRTVNTDTSSSTTAQGQNPSTQTVSSKKTYNVTSRVTSTRHSSREVTLNTGGKDLASLDLADLAKELEKHQPRESNGDLAMPFLDPAQLAGVDSPAAIIFQQLLNVEKERFANLFPQLRCVRSSPAPLETTVRIIRNADGTVTRIQTVQSRSVIRCRQVTKQKGDETKSTVRAVVHYEGPGGKVRLKLEDDGSVDSEESGGEDDDDDHDHLQLSPVKLGLPSPNSDEPLAEGVPDKAFYAAQELVDTERRYVGKLILLVETFKKRIEQENSNGRLIPVQKSRALFANLDSIYAFHKHHFLPQLQNRLREWPIEQKISDVVCQQAPFLKMYSEYINNYKRATKVFEELYKKGGKFAQIVDEVERMPECENLSLVSHIIGPVQRVMRYHLLMQVLLMQNCDIHENTLVGWLITSHTHHKYLKHLPENHCDRQDTEKALELVKSAASHANEIMRKLDKYKDLVELQEQLGCQVIELVSPSRELIKQGRLLKLSSKSDEQQTRHVFLLNDMLLVCSERKVPIHKYKLRSLLEISGMTVLEGDYLDIENTFYVRTKRKVIAFCAGTFKEKAEWMESLWSTIRELAAQHQSFRMSGRKFSKLDDRLPRKTCSLCTSTFSIFRREYTCQACRKIVCKKCCSTNKMPLAHEVGKEKRICSACFEALRADDSATQRQHRDAQNNSSTSSMWLVPANDNMLEGYLEMRSLKRPWTKSFFRLKNDFLLYRYADEKDKAPVASMPLPGIKVSLLDSRQESNGLSEWNQFVVEHKNRSYVFRCATQEEMAKWMAVLDLASKAEIPSSGSPICKNLDQCGAELQDKLLRICGKMASNIGTSESQYTGEQPT
ncbi:FYVE, RhoGEF and PH domain-containing protein 4 [Trichinella nativa]|uniref:FYVE, RhoGEF and PH domain-containing protein 4 n=1 Tax=Trichinella nativa TaxID=6335 RepID=A0A0V1LQU4_9BILA|nr:FYVE, RhoGEF and PH domain-containing protein 4 [Trichinella nativa]